MKRKIISVFVFSIITAACIPQYMLCQNFLIKGNISTSREPVSKAEITFINTDDNSKKFTALTDTLGNYQLNIITSVKEEGTSIPTKFELAQNYPNPFSNETAISYKLNKPLDVSIKIYNILGQEVRTFRIGQQEIGIHGVKWDGGNNFGEKVSRGVYLYRIQNGNETQIKKMVYTRGNTIRDLLFAGNYFAPGGFKKEAAKQVTPGTYTVAIKNNESTNPRIVMTEKTGVTIWRDTTINISVTKAPVARAGADQVVKVGQYVPLNGSGSSRGDGDTLIYKWTADSNNPAQLLFINFDPEIILGFTKEGTYKFSLVVNDGVADSEPDEAVITVAPRGESIFSDPVLELQVRYRLKNPAGEITDEKLLAIDSLVSDFGMGTVTSLEGIENLSNLTHLFFSNNRITDVTPLSGLTKLQALSLDQNYNIVDISPLANLTNLTKLNLESNNITDISALKNLTELKSLGLLGNPIEDISALKNLKILNDIWLGRYGRNIYPLTGVHVISNFTILNLLWISDCELNDVSFVSTLFVLQYLRLSFCNVSDIAPVANCTQLIRLYLDNNNITDITPLEGLTNLNILDLRYNQITNIEPLVKNSGLGQGDEIDLRGNPLDSISVNQYIPELRNRGAVVYY